MSLIRGALGAFRTESARLQGMDVLTGVATRRTLAHALEGEQKRLAQDGGVVWVLSVDVDGLKEVNDRFGHAGGDRVLVEVAQRLRSAVGERGLVARMGGDEFAVLIREELQQDELAELLHSLERMISASPVAVEGGAHQVEVTFGAAAMDGTTPPADVLSRADERMYLGKRRAGSDPFDRVSELIVGLLQPDDDGVERSLASGVAEVAAAQAAFVVDDRGEQWWPTRPGTARAAKLRALADAAKARDDLVEQGEWLLAAPLRGDGATLGAFAVERGRPFAKSDRIALARAGVALGQALLRLREGVATRRRISELEYLAFRDENTGVANRRALLAELERLADDDRPLTLLFLDFDGLRNVNNQLSYEDGNELLRAVAATIERTIRPGEMPARLHGSGGDEFIVVAPGVDNAAAPRRAEELEQELLSVQLPPALSALYGGASVGYAVRAHGEPPLDLVERAATLMRERKRLRKHLEPAHS